jgi:hypothetical protein
MSDHHLPFVYFIVLASIATLAAVSGCKAGKSGLKALFAAVWVLLVVAWIMHVPDWYVRPAGIFGISVIFGFALLVIYVPMLFAVERRSFVKLLAFGFAGAAISAVA